MTTEQRTSALALAVSACVARGWRVEAVASESAVLASGHRVNHTLHAILTVFTCFAWGLVWAVLAATTHEQRMTVTIDAQGQPVYSQPAASR